MEKLSSQEEPKENVRHLFGGIPISVDKEKTSLENFEMLRPHFEKLGIQIAESASIGNSTLQNLVKLVNDMFTPNNKPIDELTMLLLGRAKLSKGVEEISRAIDEKKMNINIGKDVTIGESVDINVNVTIGNRTRIDDLAKIGTGAVLGKEVHIQRGGFVGHDASIGDRSIIEMRAVVPPDSKLSPNSVVRFDEKGGAIDITQGIRRVK